MSITEGWGVSDADEDAAWTRSHAELAKLEAELGREFDHDIDHDHYGPDWDRTEGN